MDCYISLVLSEMQIFNLVMLLLIDAQIQMTLLEHTWTLIWNVIIKIITWEGSQLYFSRLDKERIKGKTESKTNLMSSKVYVQFYFLKQRLLKNCIKFNNLYIF